MSKRKRVKSDCELKDHRATDCLHVFVECKQNPLRLVYGATVFHSKACNVTRHYDTLRQEKYNETIGKRREDLVKKLSNFLSVQ